MEFEYRKVQVVECDLWQSIANIDGLIWSGIYELRVKDIDKDAVGSPFCTLGDNDIVKLFVSDYNPVDNSYANRIIVQNIVSDNFPNNEGVYTRTCNSVGGKYVWSTWTCERKIVDVGKVDSFDDFKNSGVYSGTYTAGDGLFESFIMQVVNNSLIVDNNEQNGCVSQSKFSLYSNGLFSHRARVGEGNDAVVWGDWMNLGAADTTDIQDNSITAQKLSIDVREKLENVEVGDNGSNDLDFVDADKNCIVRFAEGHIMTKHFDSRENTVTEEEKIKLKSTEFIDVENCDMAVTDEQNNAILVIADGHIKTKHFDSRTDVIETKYIDRDIYALGDSTTQGAGSGETSVQGSYSWFDRLVAKIQFRSYRKLAANGTTTMKQEGLGALSSQINYLPLADNPIILIMIGTNDINRAHIQGDVSAVLGMQYEELDETASFAEAYRYNLETIKRRLPNAEIIAMMPLSPQPADETEAETYRDIERTICKALSIPVLEVRNECGISKYCNYGFAQVAEDDIENATAFMADALHPNNAGYERIANYIASKLNKYIQ